MTDSCSIVFAFDPTDGDDFVIPVGKQTLNPSHIFYRPCSGIWQTVWIEPAPKNHISDLSINGDAGGQVNLTVIASQSKSSSVDITIREKASMQQNIRMVQMKLRMSRETKLLWQSIAALWDPRSRSPCSRPIFGLQTPRPSTMSLSRWERTT